MYFGVPSMNPERQFSKIFTSRVICPQNLKSKVGQTGTSEQATGHGMHCREILFTPRCSPRSRDFPRSVNFYVRRTVAELRGVKVVQFSEFGLFSLYKTTKTYLPVTSLQPRGYIAEWFRFFHVVVEGVPFGSRDFLWLLVGELGTGTPKLAQIFACGKFLYPYRMLLYGASDLDQRCLKTHNSEDGCTFPPNIFAPTPNITQNPILGDLSMQNLLYRQLSVSRTLMELRTPRQVLGVCQIFSARGRPGGRAP